MPDSRALVEVYTDGACSGNPGPGGWGAVLRYGRHRKELYGGQREPTTNNRMELTAAIEALEHLNRPSVVRLHTDSTYVRSGITQWLAHLPWPLWVTSVVIFVVAWIGQFIGHAVEGKRPSFFKDLQFLLIGPLWLLAAAYRRFSLPY